MNTHEPYSTAKKSVAVLFCEARLEMRNQIGVMLYGFKYEALTEEGRQDVDRVIDFIDDEIMGER